MNTNRWLSTIVVLAVAGLFLAPAGIVGQDAGGGPSSVDQLAIQQGIVADKYAKLEKLLEDMARIEAVSNPRRAGLLMQVLKQSKDNLTVVKLNSIARLLNQEQLKRALDNQRDAHVDMKALLELLLSENRSNRLLREQERIREYIKEVERIIRLQKSVQGRTEGGAPAAEMAKDQGKIADRTDQLAERIQENEEGGADANAKEGSQGESKEDSGDKGQGEGKNQGESKNQEKDADKSKEQGQSKDEGESKKQEQGKEGKDQGEGKEKGESKSQEQGEGKSQGQKQGQSGGQEGKESQDGQQQKQDEHPARKRIQAAEERMREAKQRLEEAKRKDALAEQEKAKEELEKAKAELERILRQLREEEVERMLALLEGRFRKMLEVQIRIYEDTIRLDRVPEEERQLKVPIPAAKLASDERKQVIDAGKALNLLIEEGSSIAFPETVEQMRDDMQQVADRLDEAKVGGITQGIEEDIIAALEEMIEALQKAQQDMEEQKNQQKPQPMQPQDMPLVDGLAELKMIRALQMRVNTRTKRYSRLLDDADDPTGQATDQDLLEALAKLADRQQRIYQITRDLVLGKNR